MKKFFVILIALTTLFVVSCTPKAEDKNACTDSTKVSVDTVKAVSVDTVKVVK